VIWAESNGRWKHPDSTTYFFEKWLDVEADMRFSPGLGGLLAVAMVIGLGRSTCAMEPPTPEQLRRYRADGSLADRAATARRAGNHRLSLMLLHRIRRSPQQTKTVRLDTGLLPSVGRQRVFALLIGFSDHRGHNHVGEIDRRLFGVGPDTEYPYESLRTFYLRSSYGLLELEGVTLGWYTAPYPRSSVPETDEGREELIGEAIDHYDAAGHDFSRYDNDGDGDIDYFLVFYAGPHQEWGDFWWGYQRTYSNGDYAVDGLRLGAYSWQWESWDVGGPFSARVAIHETGHALGLPDYYDYDDDIGPMGGLGGLDMMDNNWGDHNAFSKWVLGWLEPIVINEGQLRPSLRRSSAAGDAALLMPGDPISDPFNEYFLLQYRWRSGNDIDYPADGLLIWHVDARLDRFGRFLFDNSYTEHKLIRLMEADGLEEIEQGLGANEGDFFRPGDVFDGVSIPNSRRFDGSPTGIVVDGIAPNEGSMAFDVDLGPGCAIFADLSVPTTSWPGITMRFVAGLDHQNCDAEGVPVWSFSDGAEAMGAMVSHSFAGEGDEFWSLTTEVGNAFLRREGRVLVCDDPRCFDWRPVPPMRGPRLQHSVVVLVDGRVLVVGGGVPPEIFDPLTETWTGAGDTNGSFFFAAAQRLADGRVLVTGSVAGDPVNAEIFNPRDGTWEITGRMNFDRVMHSSIQLADGRVLIAGGKWGSGVAQSEVFDPATGAWSVAGGTGFEELPGLALLPDNKVLFVGHKATRVFDPANGRWLRVSDLVHDHKWGATVGLADGRVLVLGGEATDETEIFDPSLNLWQPGPRLNGIRAVPSAVALSNGFVVLTGGADRFWRVGSSVEVLDPTSWKWTVVEAMDESRLAHTATRLNDDSVLVIGGTAAVYEEPYAGMATVERFATPAETTPPRRMSSRQPGR
jgi:M6 family metalloprotease-like protein